MDPQTIGAITALITAVAGLVTAITALVRGNQHRKAVNPQTVQATVDAAIQDHAESAPHIYADGSTH